MEGGERRARCSIAGRSISTLIKNQGIGDLVRALHVLAPERHRLQPRLHTRHFPDTSTQTFDPVYMGQLFDIGLGFGRNGGPWQKVPPRWQN